MTIEPSPVAYVTAVIFNVDHTIESLFVDTSIDHYQNNGETLVVNNLKCPYGHYVYRS